MNVDQFKPDENDPRHFSCVYSITNMACNRVYIGSAADPLSRIKSHLSALRRNVHHCKEMQLDFNLYGEVNFNADVLYKYYGRKRSYRFYQKKELELIRSEHPHYNKAGKISESKMRTDHELNTLNGIVARLSRIEEVLGIAVCVTKENARPVGRSGFQEKSFRGNF